MNRIDELLAHFRALADEQTARLNRANVPGERLYAEAGAVREKRKRYLRVCHLLEEIQGEVAES